MQGKLGLALGPAVVFWAVQAAGGCGSGDTPLEDPVKSQMSSGQGSGGGTSGSGGVGGGGGGSAAGSPCRRLGEWQKTADFADANHVSHPLPSFARGNFYYIHTKTLVDANDRVLYSAKQNPDGSLGNFQMASGDHGGGPHGFTAVVAGGEAHHFRNGHIARFPLDDLGQMNGDVVLLEGGVDTSFGGNRYVWDSALYAPFGAGSPRVFHLGGFSFTGYDYRPNVFQSDVPLSAAFTSAGIDHPNTRPGKSAFYGVPNTDFGFVYTGESGGNRLWSAMAKADGSIGPFVELSLLPAGTGNERGDFFVAGQTLFVVRGSAVFAADILDQGALSAWQSLPALPEDQIDMTWGDGHLEGAAYGIIGGFVYLTGPKSVFYAEILPASVCASTP